MNRSSRLVPLAVLALCCLIADVSWSGIIASDSFTYNPVNSALNTKNGGTGWGGAWSSITTATVVDPTTDLMVNGIDGGNRALQFAANNDNAAVRLLSSPYSASEVYVSFLFRFDAGVINNNDFFALWFDNVSTGAHTASRPNIGLKSDRATNIPANPDYFVRLNSSTNEVYSPTQAAIGQTVQLVGRLHKLASTNYNRFDLWVNPDPGDLSTPDVMSTFASPTITSFNRIGFRTANMDAGASADRFLVDELVLATSFADVVPMVVPEPGSVLIWTIGIFCALLGIRSRRGNPGF